MASIDYSIPGQIKSIQLESPMNAMAQAMQLRGLHEASQLNNLRLQEAQREQESTAAINAAYQKAYNPTTGEVDANVLRQSIANGGFGAKIPGIEKSLAETRKEQLAQQKHLVDLEKAKFEQSRQFLEGIDPNSPNAAQQYLAWHEANHADPVLGKMLAARGVTKDSAKAQIDEAISTGRLTDLINQSKLGMEKFTQFMPAFNKENREQLNEDYSAYLNSIAGKGIRPLSIAEFKASRGKPAAAPAVESTNTLATNTGGPNLKSIMFTTPPAATAPAIAADYVNANANNKPPLVDPEADILMRSPNPADRLRGQQRQEAFVKSQAPEVKVSDIAQMQADREKAERRGDKKAVREITARIQKLTRDENAPTGPQLNADAITIAADRYLTDGTIPAGIAKSQRTAIMNRGAELAKERGISGDRLNQLETKANQAALQDLIKKETVVAAFEKTFVKNTNLVEKFSSQRDHTGVPLLQKWINNGKKAGTGDPNLASLAIAIKAVQNEYAKIVSGSMGNTQVAVSEIKNMEDKLNAAQTPQEIMAVISTMRVETQNRMEGFKEQKAELSGAMKKAVKGSSTNPNRRPLADILN